MPAEMTRWPSQPLMEEEGSPRSEQVVIVAEPAFQDLKTAFSLPRKEGTQTARPWLSWEKDVVPSERGAEGPLGLVPSHPAPVKAMSGLGEGGQVRWLSKQPPRACSGAADAFLSGGGA